MGTIMNITYELAKELKDAGLFTKHKAVFPCFLIDGEQYYLPTLSELIEALGRDRGFILSELNKGLPPNYDETYWKAETYGSEAVGSSPEEAVARLWLALNNK